MGIEDMSMTFKMAFSTYNKAEALRLYNLEIEHNDPKNFAAYYNRALIKIALGEEGLDQTLIDDAIKDLKTAIDLAKEVGNHGFPGAENNLKYALSLNFRGNV